MLAISLWQPWATLVVSGAKRWETRGWRYPERFYGEPLLIHAAQKWNRDLLEISLSEPFRTAIYEAGFSVIRELSRGAFVGQVRLGPQLATRELCARVELRERLFGDWSGGRWAWEMLSPEQFSEPIEARGRQGFFRYEPAAPAAQEST